MPEPIDLNEVITESIEDAELPADPDPVEDSTDGLEAAPEPTETPVEPAEAPDPTSAVESPAAKQTAPQDDFEKKYGIPAQSQSGRENRIPYPRVKKIVSKAEKDTEVRLKAEFEPKIKEYEEKLQTYEVERNNVMEFEKVMFTDHVRFLEWLTSTVPGYKEIFSQLSGNQAQTGTPSTPATPDEEMPQPDQKLEDGSMVYSMDGLKKLMDWQAKQVESKVTKQVSDRYAPIEERWKAEERMQRILPQVQKQIEEARTWPQFTENEEEITKALAADPKLSLEGAYRKVVFPKLSVDRSKMREELLAEIKKTPTSTSVPTSRTKPGTPTAGPRSIEDIIKESIDASGLRKG